METLQGVKLTSTNWPCGLTTIFFYSKRVSYHSFALLRVTHMQLNRFPVAKAEGVTPVPISNTEVKPSSADGTIRSPYGRVGRRRDLRTKSHASACAWLLYFRALFGSFTLFPNER